MLELYLAILLISSSRKTRNSQSLESCNQYPTYGILIKGGVIILRGVGSTVFMHLSSNCDYSLLLDSGGTSEAKAATALRPQWRENGTPQGLQHPRASPANGN